jgi:hypothetical protein
MTQLAIVSVGQSITSRHSGVESAAAVVAVQQVSAFSGQWARARGPENALGKGNPGAI